MGDQRCMQRHSVVLNQPTQREVPLAARSSSLNRVRVTRSLLSLRGLRRLGLGFGDAARSGKVLDAPVMNVKLPPRHVMRGLKL